MRSLSRIPPFLGIIFLLIGLAPAAPPRIFDDAREAIRAAREEGGPRLILFMLLDGESEESNRMASLLRGELVLLGNEFVIVQGSLANADDRALFSDRFGKSPTGAPLAVIADVNGNLLAASEGNSREHYQAMIESARNQAGFVKPKEPPPPEEKEPERVGGGVIAMKIEDIEAEKLPMTEFRPWVLTDGTSFRAALLEANGTKGIFILEGNKKRVELEFTKLSPSDLAFLTTALGDPGAR